MSAIRINQFGAMRPRVDPRLLNDNEAQVARDCDLYSGVLRAIHGNVFLQWPGISGSNGDCATMYLHDYYNQMLAFGNISNYSAGEHIRDVVRSPIANNEFKRVYISGESYAASKMGWTSETLYQDGNDKDYPNPTYNYRVEVPRPSITPTCTLTAGTPSDVDNVEDRTYVTTFVTSWNGIEAESAPSDPSAAISVTPGDEVNIECGVTTPPHSGAFMPGASIDTYWKLRVYRTVTGIGGAEYQFVDEVTNWYSGSNNLLESLVASELGEALQTEHFTIPDDELYNLTAMPNGIMAANIKNTNQLFFCEPYQPHTYPLLYSLSTEDDIVAIGAFGDSLCVGTKGAPYIVTGIHPSAMSMIKIELAQACVSKQSMVDMGPYVIYASPEGLVAVGPGMAKVITEDLFTTEEWKDYAPETIIATRWEDKYIGFYDNTSSGGSLNGGFIFDPNDPNARFVQLAQEDVKGAYTHAESGTVWLSTLDSTGFNMISQWNVDDSDPKFTTDIAPAMVDTNFDVELPANSVNGGVWTTLTGVTNTLQWNNPNLMEWGTSYYVEFTIDSNTCTDTTTFLARFGMDTVDIDVTAGQTGTIQMPLGTENHMMNFDEFFPMTPDLAMQLIRQSFEGDGTIVISDITVYPTAPGQYSDTTSGLGKRDYLWKSKVFHNPKPINPAAAQIQGDQTVTDPIKFTLWADGVKVFEKENVTDSRPFRLPDGYMAEEFEVQFEGRAEIRDFAMATTMRELAVV